MPYPLILGGDHAAFEQEWAASGRPENERPDWPLPSFDAQDWAAAFCRAANQFRDAKGEPIDEGWMITWFANALMRGHDQARADNDQQGKLERALREIIARDQWDQRGDGTLAKIARAALEHRMREDATARVGKLEAALRVCIDVIDLQCTGGPKDELQDEADAAIADARAALGDGEG